MPCLNAGQYLEEALRSVLLQGYPDLELMVFDGGSTDGTVEIIRQYAPWLTYWASEKDRGQSHAINKGLERATGEWFNWFNADDVMCQGALLTFAASFQADHGVIGVFGSMISFDPQGVQTRWDPVLGTKEEIGNWAAPVFLPQPAALFSREACQRIGGVNERLHYVMDIELMMRLADCGRFALVDGVTARFRAHEGSKTVQGDIPGLVELIAAEFSLGLPRVAERLLQRRLDGYAGLTVDHLTDDELAEVVDRWSYGMLVRYVIRRLNKNLRLLLGCKRKYTPALNSSTTLTKST
jgi:glycosyltransferase involved in cell wall biosynthesis